MPLWVYLQEKIAMLLTILETQALSLALAAYTSWATGTNPLTNSPFSGGRRVFSCTICFSFLLNLASRLSSLTLVTNGFLSDFLRLIGSSTWEEPVEYQPQKCLFIPIKFSADLSVIISSKFTTFLIRPRNISAHDNLPISAIKNSTRFTCVMHQKKTITLQTIHINKNQLRTWATCIASVIVIVTLNW